MKDLIRLSDLSQQKIETIFKIADNISDYKDVLKGKTLILFFPESSIRTRVTFEKGVHALGAQGILFPSNTLDKKEDLRDVAGYLDNWADGAIIRHKNIDLIQKFASFSKNMVINAMTSENHPCEILSDLYSLSKVRNHYLKDKYLFTGAAGNIGKSWAAASEILNFDLIQSCPEGYEIEGLKVINNIKEAVQGKDIVLTDPVPASQREAFELFQITEKLMESANDNGVLNPCPPFTRGVEVSADVISSRYFAGYQFKENLLSVQQAIILYLMGY